MKQKTITILIFILAIIGYFLFLNKEKEYIGVYQYGADIETFTDSTGQVYWVHGEEKILESLHNIIDEIRNKEANPYPELKLKVKGIDRGKATNEFAEDKDKVLEIKEYKILN